MDAGRSRHASILKQPSTVDGFKDDDSLSLSDDGYVSPATRTQQVMIVMIAFLTTFQVAGRPNDICTTGARTAMA
jgi:hypothetical protein